MGKIVLLTGGARSGKSSFAEKLAKAKKRKLYFIATGEPRDSEMKDRIDKHKKRRGGQWKTFEEPIDIKKAFAKIKTGTVVLDCVTLWISNLIGKGFSDIDIKKETQAVLKAVKNGNFNVIIVTNDAGSGVIPLNKLARRYIDTLGLVNQLIAKSADTVYIMHAGIAVCIKGGHNGKD